jgi:pyruvate dehydrogenase E2 component (dihydrolipoamide acetyltransferase)/putative redox protein
MALVVVATWRGGFATDVEARGHAIRVDEPETAGGTDAGMMPTELFCAALASCFCLAVGFAAGKRDLDVPGLRVTVTAERVDGELRYEHFVVNTEAAVEPDLLARLVEHARPLCWISNSLASGVSVEYVHATTVNEDFRK